MIVCTHECLAKAKHLRLGGANAVTAVAVFERSNQMPVAQGRYFRGLFLGQLLLKRCQSLG